MQITVTIEDTLYAQALDLLDRGSDETDLFSAALETFIQVRSAKRLADAGGAAPDMADVPRR